MRVSPTLRTGNTSMSALVEKFHRFRAPPTAYESPEEARRASLINVLSLATIVLGIIAPLLLLLYDLISAGSISFATIRFSLLMLGLFVVAIVAKIILQRGSMLLAGWTLLSAYWLLSTTLAVTSGGIRDTSLMVYLLVIVLAAFILGRKQAVLFAGLSIISAAIQYFLEINGLLATQWSTSPTVVDLVSLVSILILTGVLILQILVTFELTEEEEEHKSTELEDLQLELQQTQSALETCRNEAHTNDMLWQIESEVAKDAATIPDLPRFLTETVQLISDRLGYYHVGIFTLDGSQDHAVLRAASSEGGQQLVNSEFRLPVGKVGLVGFTTGTGKIRIANEINSDPVYSAVPELPFTRAEIVLPLTVDENILGALDIQSEDSDVFAPPVVKSLEALADQIALTIQRFNLQGEISTLHEEQRLIAGAVDQLSTNKSYDSLLTLSTALVLETFGVMRATVGVMEGDYVVVRSCSAKKDIPSVPIGGVQPVGQSVLGHAITRNESVQISGPLIGGEFTPNSAGQDEMTHTYATPLRSSSGTKVALAVEYDPSQVDTKFHETLNLVTVLIALSLENAQLQERIQENQVQLDELYRGRVHEDWMDYLGSRAERGAPRTIEFQSQTLPEDEVARSSEYATPIELRGEVIGKLAVQGVQQSEWTEEDLVILQSVADEVAGTLEQMRLMEELERRATQLQTASEIARDATGQLDEFTLLRGAVELIRERFDLYHVSVLLLDKEGNSAEVREASGEAEAQIRSSALQVKVGSHSILGHVTEHGECYVAHNVSEDDYYQPHPLLPETRTELGVPLKIGERVIGALDVQGTQAFTFTEDDIAVFEVLADQLAVAIQNARLFEEAKNQAEREKMVTDISRKIRASSDINTILQTTILELQNALGANRARIALKPFSTESESSPTTNLNREEGSTDGDNGSNLSGFAEGSDSA